MISIYNKLFFFLKIMSIGYLIKLINIYKEKGEKIKYIDSFYNMIILDLDTVNSNTIKEFVQLINTNKILFLSEIFEKIIENNKLKNMIDILWLHDLFDITSLINLIEKLDNDKRSKIINFLFDTSDIEKKENKQLWFQKESYIGKIINKSNTLLLDISLATSLDIENLKDINRLTLYKHTNKITYLFYKYNNVHVMNWLSKLVIYDKITTNSIDKFFMFNLTHTILNMFRKIYLLYPTIRNKIDLNYSIYNNNENTKDNHINVLFHILLYLLETCYLQFKKDYHTNLEYLKHNLNVSSSEAKRRKKYIINLNTYIYNPYFRDVFNFFIDTIIKINLNKVIKKKVIKILCSINLDTDHLTTYQFNYLIDCFIENINNNDYLTNIDFINVIVDNYYYRVQYIKNSKFLESLLQFYTNDQIKEITDIYENTYYIEFMKDIIKSKKLIGNNSKKEINKLINGIIGNLNDFLQNISIYVPKIQNYKILKRFKAFHRLSANTQLYQQYIYNTNKKLLNNSCLIVKLMLDLLNQISLYFNKNLYESYTIKNMATCFNHFLSVIITKKPSLLKLKEYSLKYYTPATFVKKILFIYTNIHTDNLINIIAEDQLLDVMHYKKALNIITLSKNVETYISFKFKYIIQKIEEHNIKKNTLKNIPVKYIDQLTMELMKNPVQLPSSKMIVDLNTIKNILAEKKEDPYDRNYLTEDMLIYLNDLKKEINLAYFNS
jgi:hypothetical protein